MIKKISQPSDDKYLIKKSKDDATYKDFDFKIKSEQEELSYKEEKKSTVTDQKINKYVSSGTTDISKILREKPVVSVEIKFTADDIEDVE